MKYAEFRQQRARAKDASSARATLPRAARRRLAATWDEPINNEGCRRLSSGFDVASAPPARKDKGGGSKTMQNSYVPFNQSRAMCMKAIWKNIFITLARCYRDICLTYPGLGWTCRAISSGILFTVIGIGCLICGGGCTSSQDVSNDPNYQAGYVPGQVYRIASSIAIFKLDGDPEPYRLDLDNASTVNQYAGAAIVVRLPAGAHLESTDLFMKLPRCQFKENRLSKSLLQSLIILILSSFSGLARAFPIINSCILRMDGRQWLDLRMQRI